MKFIYGFVLGIILMYILYEIKNQCLLGGGRNALLATIIQNLTRQAARWSTASVQDDNAMVAVLHANYGAGYLWALKDVASSEQVKAATGIDLVQFEKEIIKAQDAATTTMAQLCPRYAPDPTYLTKIGGEE
tara:strand:+ start:236 stop:631 length:396 start_codon:yes stop_codon:yes gene_type:complete